MIRVHRSAEPESLQNARWWRLARAVLAHGRGKPITFEGYDTDDVREPLYRGQQEKCAYCEMEIQKEGQPVEHFRPKNHAIRSVKDSGPRDDDRYWWLAWTWENLLFACVSCNSPSRKGNRFPLAAGSAACAIGPATPHLPPAVPRDEVAQLIDPSHEDPLDFIEYVLDGDDWVPTGRDGNQRGLDTVTILHLDDRDSLLGKYDRHVKQTVGPYVDSIREAAASGDEQAVRQAWQRAVCGLVVSDGAPFRALAYDLLAATFDAAFRARFRLSLPRPGARATQPPRPTADCSGAHLAGLPDDVVWQVRAIGPPQSSDRNDLLKDALAAICAHGPCTLDELVRYTRCAETKVQATLELLVREQRLAPNAGRYAVASP